MNSQGKLGIGTLQHAQQTSDEDCGCEEKTADEAPEKEASGEEPTEKEAAVSGEEPSVPAGTNSEPSAQTSGGPQKSGTMVYDQSPQSSGRPRVALKCGATSCIFNRQKNCMASEVEIEMSPEKGRVPSATNCQTYQPAPSGQPNDNSSTNTPSTNEQE